MAAEPAELDLSIALKNLELASQEGKLLPTAVANIRKWLVEPAYAQYAPEVARHLAAGKFRELNDVFWMVIPFGTGGRRGRMYPIGCNAINERTIGESAQGLADYVLRQPRGAERPSCAIAYDTRINSPEFAKLCAGIMVANGFDVYFLNEFRSTPELSFLVRDKNCSCGIMVTASHNPPCDNAVKVYWSTGGQVLPPHDKGIIECVANVAEIKRMDFADAMWSDQVKIVTAATDRKFVATVARQGFAGPRDVKILYTSLHGVGRSAVPPVLAADGFADVEVYEPNAEYDGRFPNVPHHVSNPEVTDVYAGPIARAIETGADIVLATDPDCDRMGCAARLTPAADSPFQTFNGNQLSALLTDFVLERRRQAGTLPKDGYLVKTLVTTDMLRRIGDSYGVRTQGNLHVGFKYIGEEIDKSGPDQFLFGAEESHGYLVGQYARDKDGAVACLLISELAAALKAKKQTLHQKLDSLYWQHGYHAEHLINVTMTGASGMLRMKALMAQVRSRPPQSLGGLGVAAVRDYLNLTRTPLGGAKESLDAPRGDMVVLDLATPGNYIAVRPSGTEPKVKFYLFAFVPAEQLANLDDARADVAARFAKIHADLKALVDSIPEEPVA